jgi:release factor glutamine methyltransferase
MRNTRITSIDSSADALEVAKLNAGYLGVTEHIVFVNANFLEPVESLRDQQFDFLTSNPPYVSLQEWQDLDPEVREFEPRQAVSDQNDGYEFYRRIGQEARQIVRNGGWVIVEVGDGQAEHVSNIFRSAALTEISVVNDLQETPRVVLGRVT